MRAMLATETPLSRLPSLLGDAEWWCEPKYDGIRTLVQADSQTVKWLNRNGHPLTKPVPASVHQALASTTHQGFTLDGELVGNHLMVFDVPWFKQDLTSQPAHHRQRVAADIVRLVGCPSLRIAPCARVRSAKLAMLDTAFSQRWEGLIFKRYSGRYQQGARSTSMLKLKLTKTADCVIGALSDPDGKDNATLFLRDSDRWVEVGRVSLVGKESVSVGDVIEVRFLHTSANGRLVQPRMLRKRTDKTLDECHLSQLVSTQLTNPSTLTESST